jgi:RHS repeat-associated protein
VTFRFDEFGNPVSGSAGRYGWLGGRQRRTELPSGVIQMGARSYVPAMGRLLTPDLVPGGSANAYDYANQDPVNLFDLLGERCTDTYGNPFARERRRKGNCIAPCISATDCDP